MVHQQSEGRIVAQLFPLISGITELSWENLVESHARWSEEVIALCALAGPGVHSALDPHAAYEKIMQRGDDGPNRETSLSPSNHLHTNVPGGSGNSSVSAASSSHSDNGTLRAGEVATMSTSNTKHASTSKGDKAQSKEKNANTKKKKKKKNVMKATYTEQDDRVARAIIVLTMTRDLRQRFAKLMKAAVTARQLFNGLAIMKEAVNEGAAYEEDPGATIPEPPLHTIRSKAQAMAEEMDWSTPVMTRDLERKFLFFRISKPA